jgi:hypothetical protein
MSQHHPQHPHRSTEPAPGAPERAEHTPAGGAPEGRRGDRRGGDRRRVERRAPLPPWRKPWALVAYGVVGAVAVMMMLGGLGGDGPPPVRDETLVEKQSEGVTGVEPANPQATAAAPEDAYGAAGFERLVVQGEGAVGKVVRAEVYCEAPQNFTVIQGHTAPRSVASLIQEGRVPAARCRWGAPNEPRREEFVLIVPPARAEEFATAAVVKDGFVERRRLFAEMEWVGRSETLALRTAGVFRGLVPQ